MTYIITEDDDPQNILAASTLHNRYTINTCNDFTYGCCYIYEMCQTNDSPYPHLSYHKDKLDVYVIYSHDILRSNCPSLRSIINQYNQKYGSDECGEFGCCPDFMNIQCDDTIHNHINEGNDQTLIDHFKNNSKKIPIKVSKIDESGSNCWNNDGFLSGIPHFIYKYNHNFPDPPEPLSWFEIIVRGILAVFAIIFIAKGKC